MRSPTWCGQQLAPACWMACLELVMFALLMRAGPAWAGQYVVSYSGDGAS